MSNKPDGWSTMKTKYHSFGERYAVYGRNIDGFWDCSSIQPFCLIIWCFGQYNTILHFKLSAKYSGVSDTVTVFFNPVVFLYNILTFRPISKLRWFLMPCLPLKRTYRNSCFVNTCGDVLLKLWNDECLLSLILFSNMCTVLFVLIFQLSMLFICSFVFYSWFNSNVCLRQSFVLTTFHLRCNCGLIPTFVCVILSLSSFLQPCCQLFECVFESVGIIDILDWLVDSTQCHILRASSPCIECWRVCVRISLH